MDTQTNREFQKNLQANQKGFGGTHGCYCFNDLSVGKEFEEAKQNGKDSHNTLQKSDQMQMNFLL